MKKQPAPYPRHDDQETNLRHSVSFAYTDAVDIGLVAQDAIQRNPKSSHLAAKVERVSGDQYLATSKGNRP